jgi:LacI family transcriptional regulator
MSKRKPSGASSLGMNIPTLRDVAERAAVDISTVSKVLNNGSITVRPETRERIEEAARDLRYRPNASARGLRLLRTGALGMLIPDLANPAYATIVHGAMRRAEELGFVMLLAEFNRARSVDAYRMLVQERRIDGLLIATARDTSSVEAEFEHFGVPHIFVNRASASSHSVTIDDEAAAALGTDALIKASHRKLALIAGPSDVDTARRRRLGFERACAEAGINRFRVVSRSYTGRGGYAGMRELLSRGTRPTGVFVSNLLAALGALAAVSEAGLSVPLDLSLVAYEDAELAEFAQPPLTTVAVPFDEMGSAAVEVLVAVLRGESRKSLVVPTAPLLIERSSVASPIQSERTSRP